MLKRALVLSFCVFVLTHAFEEEDSVLVLNKANFQTALSTYENVLVEFYAPWCGHCQKLAPEFAKAAEYFKNEGNKVRLAKVDATVDEDLAREYGVDGFPTLIMFVDGKPSPYTGGRTSYMIIGWIKKKVELPSVLIENVSDLDTIVEKANLAVVFYGDEFDLGFRIYRTVASNHMEIPFFHTVSEEIKAKYNPTGEAKISLIKNFDEGRVDFDSDYTEKEIEEFVLRNRFPKFFTYEEKYAKIIFGDLNPAMFLMTGRGESTDKAIEEFKLAASEMYGKILFTLCETEEELCHKVVKYFGLLREEVPAVYLFQPPTQTQRPEKYLLEKRITKENIAQLYNDWKLGKLIPVLRSEELPENFDSPVKTIVQKTFKNMVFDDNKDVIVFYSSHNCEDCEQISELMKGFAKLVLPIEDLIIGQVGLDGNELSEVKIEKTPQISLYPRNRKSDPITFSGEKTIQALYDFFKTSLTVEYDESLINVEETLKAMKREAEEKAIADERARQRMKELEAANKAREAAGGDADFNTDLEDDDLSVEYILEEETPQVTQDEVKKHVADGDL